MSIALTEKGPLLYSVFIYIGDILKRKEIKQIKAVGILVTNGEGKMPYLTGNYEILFTAMGFEIN